MIDFTKYLNCPACKEVELYCHTHRAEVEKILENKNQTFDNKDVKRHSDYCCKDNIVSNLGRLD